MLSSRLPDKVSRDSVQKHIPLIQEQVVRLYDLADILTDGDVSHPLFDCAIRLISAFEDLNDHINS